MDPITRLTLITVLLFMARGMTGPLSSLYWRSLGASYLVIGLLGTVTSVTTIGASALWGRASDRRGRRGFLVGGLAALAARTGAAELMVTSTTAGYDEKVTSLELLAEVLGLG